MRGKFSYHAGTFARVCSAVHATNVRLTPTKYLYALHCVALRGATEFAIEISGGVFVIREEQHFLTLEFTCQEFLKAGKLGVPVRCDGSDIVPDFTQSFGIASQIVVQPLE